MDKEVESRISKLEKDVEALKERNRRVEGDKGWETSSARIFSIAGITYVVAAVFLYVVEVERPLFAAIVPALGYYLSTLSLPAIKRWWMTRSDRRV